MMCAFSFSPPGGRCAEANTSALLIWVSSHLEISGYQTTVCMSVVTHLTYLKLDVIPNVPLETRDFQPNCIKPTSRRRSQIWGKTLHRLGESGSRFPCGQAAAIQSEPRHHSARELIYHLDGSIPGSKPDEICLPNRLPGARQNARCPSLQNVRSPSPARTSSPGCLTSQNSTKRN